MASDLLQQFIERYIAPQLKAAGFRKRAETWNRSDGDIVHVIDIQSSRWSVPHRATFTLNVGVLVWKVERILWGKQPSRTVRESSCFPRFRIGFLPGVDAGKDIWWNLHNGSEFERIAAEVTSILREKCLPILDQCRSLSEALSLADGAGRWKQPAERLALAIMLCLGDSPDGPALLEAMEADPKLEVWRPRIIAVRKRLRAIDD